VCGTERFVAGIDEAGRGPVIGPMIMACVAVRKDLCQVLIELGVRDSKTLSPIARRRVSKTIRGLAAEVRTVVVEPHEIDAAVEGIGARNLNDLEARVAAALIDSLETDVYVVYVDSPDPKPERYASAVTGYLRRRRGVRVIADNDAESKYAVVAAASIVAKVERDKIIRSLERIYGPLGSGYPSDPRTREFLERWVRERGSLPPIVRRSWKTAKRLLLSLEVGNDDVGKPC